MYKKDFWMLGVKVWIKIAIAIFLCFSLSLFVNSTGMAVKVLLQIIYLCILGGMVYQFFWRTGSNDNNLVFMKMGKKNLNKGMILGIAAIIPYLLLYVMMIIAKRGIFNSEMVDNVILLIYYLFNVPFHPFINSVLFSLHGDFADVSVGSVLLSGISFLFIPLVSSIAYYMGYRQISVLEHLTYKNLNKK